MAGQISISSIFLGLKVFKMLFKNYKNHLRFLLITMILFISISCGKDFFDTPFVKYTVSKGNHYSIHDGDFLNNDILQFDVKFDNTVIYSLSDTNDQKDFNKLYGFCDCNSLVHENSARFGWRWYDNQIEIFAYYYVNGKPNIDKMSSMEDYMGSVKPNEVNHYSIRISGNHYIFQLNNKILETPRHQKCKAGGYYKLYPYFGGTSIAPHDINIYIKEKYNYGCFDEVENFLMENFKFTPVP